MCLDANFSPLVLAKLILPKIMLRISLFEVFPDPFDKVSSVFDVRISFVLVPRKQQEKWERYTMEWKR
jgi:hypothetical protein